MVSCMNTAWWNRVHPVTPLQRGCHHDRTPGVALLQMPCLSSTPKKCPFRHSGDCATDTTQFSSISPTGCWADPGCLLGAVLQELTTLQPTHTAPGSLVTAHLTFELALSQPHLYRAQSDEFPPPYHSQS